MFTKKIVLSRSELEDLVVKNYSLVYLPNESVVFY